jgi:hypothetical protein
MSKRRFHHHKLEQESAKEYSVQPLLCAFCSGRLVYLAENVWQCEESTCLAVQPRPDPDALSR